MYKFQIISDKLILIFFVLGLVSFSFQDHAQEKGIASFYHSKFEGRKTASGEFYHQDSLTAAHKSLPFGTMVKIVNLKNDSFIVLRINDRLPKSSKRMIDVSRSAALHLNFIRAGITSVSMEIIP